MKRMLIFVTMTLLFSSCVCQREIHKESTEVNADSTAVKTDASVTVSCDSVSLIDKSVETEKEVSTSEKDATSTIVETIEETESPDGSKTRITNRVINLHVTEVDSSEYIHSLENDIAYERHRSDSLANIIYEINKSTYSEKEKTYDKNVNKWDWFASFMIGLVLGGATVLVLSIRAMKDHGKEDKT